MITHTDIPGGCLLLKVSFLCLFSESDYNSFLRLITVNVLSDTTVLQIPR